MTTGSGEHDGPLALLKTYADSLVLLFEAAGVTRTANSPVSDFAEHLVAHRYKTMPVTANRKGYDVVTPDGERVQVKALWQRTRRRRNLSALRGLELDPAP